MKPSTPESKHQRFVRLAEARTNKIFHAIKDATADAENRFRKKGSGNRRFTLS